MTIKKVLIGIDDSKYAEHAAEYGFDFARQFNATVGLVNIIEPVILASSGMGADPFVGVTVPGSVVNEMEILDVQKTQSENIMDRIIDKLGAGLQVTHFSDYGATADGIINCCKEFGADIIIVGTHHRSGLERLLTGSTAEHVIRHSSVPVLIVPFIS
jgi:nucleotide-binding universal stress UspA family protein